VTPAARVGSALAVALALASATGCSRDEPTAPPPPAEAAAGYVGSAVCGTCHAAEHDAWTASDHHRAWQPAAAATVLGDFGGARFDDHGEAVRFERRDGAYYVHTIDRGGASAPQRVEWTFGVDPLQQYLVSQTGGRLHVLPWAWDTRKSGDGGQRWYSLYPDEDLEPGDALHWTGWGQNWNSQCGDCHATHLRKGYDEHTQTFATTWSEVGVGCEACHGPGSTHAKDPKVSTASLGATASNEIEVCAPCHARRSALRDGYQAGLPWLDYFRPAIALPPQYQADGQIDEEVFEYGSFLQSRMHTAGVRCSDCHDSHSGGLREQGNALCTRCHSPSPPAKFVGLQAIAGAYDSPAHHMHIQGSAGAECVACHMPARTYMGVDRRRDHGFRVPRPDLTLTFGVDNTCTQCHTFETAAWARDAIARHVGRGPRERPTETIAAGTRRLLAAEADLAALASDATAPVMSRAAAVALLAHYPRGYAVDAIRGALAADDPLIVLAALDAADRLPPAARRAAIGPLLSAPHLAVRIEAGRVLANQREAFPPGTARDALDAAIAEYRATQIGGSDTPQGDTNLGLLEQSLGRVDAAEAAYLRAIDLDPNWVPARVNLADLYRGLGREAEAGPHLEAAVRVAPDAAGAQYALALWHVRQGAREKALPLLAIAAKTEPIEPRYVYGYALALNDSGAADDALTALRTGLAAFPDDLDMLELVALILRDAGRHSEALAAARRLDAALPGNPRAAELLRSLR
jgi:predicted CXXCH cytochrome family protein